MKILFIPFVTPPVPDGDPARGILTRALARDLAQRVGGGEGTEAVFRPFAHMLEGKRVFGVYGERWPAKELRRLAEDVPGVEYLVHGDLELPDPVKLTVEVLRVPAMEQVAEETFEAPRFAGFDVVAGAARFVLRSLGLPADAPGIGEFPARTFEGYVCLLRGREAASGLDGWGEPQDPEEVFEPFFEALDLEPKMEAAKEGICLVAAAAAVRGVVPLPAARAALDRLLEIDRRSWQAHAARARVLAALGEHRAAAEAWHRALEIDPGRASLRFELGLTLLAEGRPGRAAKTLETVKSDARLGGRALLLLGKIRAEKGDLEAAMEYWRESAERHPEDPEPWALLGRAHSQRGEFAEAEEAFSRALAAGPPAPLAHLGYGVHLAEQDRYKEAREQLRKAIRLGGRNPLAELHLGKCLAAEGERLRAIEYLRRALRGDETVKRLAREALDDLTSAERQAKLLETLDEAVERPAEEQVVLLKELMKEEAAFGEARVRYGIALVAVGKPRAAEAQFRKALKILPEDAEAWSGLATALRARKKLKAALEAHERAIDFAPNHAPYHLNYADTLLRMNRVREAAREVEIARTLDPRHPLLPNFVRSVKLFLSEQAKKTKPR